MNKDFQLFVAVLCNTVHSYLPFTPGAVSISEVLKMAPIWWNVESSMGLFKGKSHATVQEMLGDIVSSIRFVQFSKNSINPIFVPKLAKTGIKSPPAKIT